jgi:predicted O-methyltransferase YrrM
MSSQLLAITPDLNRYLQTYGVRDSAVLAGLREKTQTLVGAEMQISPLQGQLMQVLLQSIKAKRVLEIGTYTGYSALVMAQALPDDGLVVTCEVSEPATLIARDYWQQAGVAHKIQLRLGAALDTLETLIEAKMPLFDFIFIDADKGNYLAYYEKGLSLLRVGGMIAIDNVLWGGDVVNSSTQDERTLAIQKLNQHIHQDTRVNASMIPIGDGLTLAVKLPVFASEGVD